MREEGLAFATCKARVQGGWRTNQYDEGHFGVRLAILSGGGSTSVRDGRRPQRPPHAKSNRPEPAQGGPLRGEWVAIIGATSDGDMARNSPAKAGALWPVWGSLHRCWSWRRSDRSVLGWRTARNTARPNSGSAKAAPGSCRCPRRVSSWHDSCSSLGEVLQRRAHCAATCALAGGSGPAHQQL